MLHLDSGYDNLKLLNESNGTSPINKIVDDLKMNKLYT